NAAAPPSAKQIIPTMTHATPPRSRGSEPAPAANGFDIDRLGTAIVGGHGSCRDVGVRTALIFRIGRGEEPIGYRPVPYWDALGERNSVRSFGINSFRRRAFVWTAWATGARRTAMQEASVNDRHSQCPNLPGCMQIAYVPNQL